MLTPITNLISKCKLEYKTAIDLEKSAIQRFNEAKKDIIRFQLLKNITNERLLQLKKVKKAVVASSTTIKIGK